MFKETQETLDRVRNSLDQLGRFLDVPKKRERLKELEALAAQPAFWDVPQEAQKTMKETDVLREQTTQWDRLDREWQDRHAHFELAREVEDMGELQEAIKGLQSLEKSVGDLTTKAKLAGPMDRNNAIVSLHAGAGGTEACDWVDMLFRMYQRWSESKGFRVEITDVLPGEEAGIKRITFLVNGPYAYGLLQSEAGVHRLVRISPFDSNARRHTSFAASDVLPEIDDNIDVQVNEADLRIDTYRAGGHGGQYVNKTESAVRITHAPSGVVVQSQNERSQFKNKAMCLKMLKAKLYDLELEKQRAVVEKHYDSKGDIAWGNQIRSYVFMPYQMVKDLRSGHETSQINSVMDGDLDPFINAYLGWKLSGEKPRRSVENV
ncbi:MAG: peptide chain release factor 2 [Elusimicrobia bacterium]|nr:peptide chain release factor 2 [Elusimicrobiota bacterium]